MSGVPQVSIGLIIICRKVSNTGTSEWAKRAKNTTVAAVKTQPAGLGEVRCSRDEPGMAEAIEFIIGGTWGVNPFMTPPSQPRLATDHSWLPAVDEGCTRPVRGGTTTCDR